LRKKYLTVISLVNKKLNIENPDKLNVPENDFKNRLQQANQLETIGLLTNGIVHDFNNIIATISGYAELMHDELPAGSPLSEKTEKILAASRRARLMAEQIMNISNSENLKKSVVNVNSILRETLDLVRSSAVPGVKISLETADNELKVMADPTQLLRVFLNLATNALQQLKNMGGTLEIKTMTISGEMAKSIHHKDFLVGEYILITFRDNGPGIDKVHLKRIFEPFYSAGKKSKGSGLGLSIVLGILKEMNGDILVSTRKKKGTVFSIYIPAWSN
jgi:signal transduction histidine kinase